MKVAQPTAETPHRKARKQREVREPRCSIHSMVASAVKCASAPSTKSAAKALCMPREAWCWYAATPTPPNQQMSAHASDSRCSSARFSPSTRPTILCRTKTTPRKELSEMVMPSAPKLEAGWISMAADRK